MFSYNLGILFYRLAIGLASLFHAKAAKMLSGRKGTFEKLEQFRQQNKNKKIIWFHVASLGEFEQGRPLIDQVKKTHPGTKILLTFFSPSGYEVRKDYENADCVVYLPFDFPTNARRFLDVVKPDTAIFIKYEFWLNFLNELNRKQMPVYLVSAVFHPAQPFFRWYGNPFIKALHFYKHIFVQDKNSYDLLATLKVKNTSISGDTRFDRVLATAEHPMEINEAASFAENNFVIVAGSTWETDELLLVKVYEKMKSQGEKIKMIFAPHEIDASNISRLKKLLSDKKISFSVFSEGVDTKKEILVMDTIGMLSSLYRYGKIAYVGGGFHNGIHNILEAAVFGMPVFFGPNYFKFSEAHSMLANKTAFSVQNENELFEKLNYFLQHPEELKQSSSLAEKFVKDSSGATQKVLAELKWE